MKWRRVSIAATLASDVEAEQHHVAVLNDIILAFRPHLAGVARSRFAAEIDEVFVGDGLGADEAALEVGVNLSGRLRRLCTAVRRLGARFLWTGGEEGDEAKQLVAGVDHTVEAGLVKS